MKSLLRRMRVHLSLLVLCVLLVPGTALAYWDVDSQLALADEDMPLIYGTLNQRMATRTGPSTDYPEPGTFLSKGKQVRIISVAFDANEVPWVQVELTYGKKHIRAYTGLKRFDQVDVNDIPREFNYDFEAILNQDVTPLYGPGTEYSAYSFTLEAGSSVSVIDYENGYAMCDFYAQDDEEWNRVWIPDSLITVVN